ncbi:MAG: hypothetical protein LKJ76_02090 [Lachnospiraceae bacterium]|jgi:hypothetical protein|nr:hypothetical protein [Lachnospiraceae bacterium]
MGDDGMPPFLQDMSTREMGGSGCGTCLLYCALLVGGGAWLITELVRMLIVRG